MTLLERRHLFRGPSGARLSSLTHLGTPLLPFYIGTNRTPGLIGTALLVFLPPAIAVFPQRGTLDTKLLEKRFRELEFEKVEFNKGL